MRLPFRLASRYIVKRRSGTLVHLISGISVTVIASVAAAMVCILSAFNGIEDLVKDLFGTLDADSLDVALATLTNLRQDGKLIGIISHVETLKQSIPTQIKVEKGSGGHSRLKGAGCYNIKTA